MIIDKINNANLYDTLSPKIQKGLEFIKQNNLENFENGKYEIDGENIYIIIQDYNSKPLIDGKWEAHEKYIDIQFIIKGQEKMGYLNIDEFTPETQYDNEKDIVFGEGSGSFVDAKENYFIIFTPQDAHMPGIKINKSEYVKKAVVKIIAD